MEDAARNYPPSDEFGHALHLLVPDGSVAAGQPSNQEWTSKTSRHPNNRYGLSPLAAESAITRQGDCPFPDPHVGACSGLFDGIEAALYGGRARKGRRHVADTDNNRVVEVPAGGGAQTTVASGLKDPSGVAVDAEGDVFIADTGNNRVVEVPAGGGPLITVASGLSEPAAVAVYSPPPKFMAASPPKTVIAGTYKYKFRATTPSGEPVGTFVPSSGTYTAVVGGLSNPAGEAVDKKGDLFIADTGNNRVVEVPPGGGSETTVGSGLSAPQGVAVDKKGDVFIADTGHNQVVEVPAGGGAQTTVGGAADSRIRKGCGR
ncbi:MAG: hypothetical protein WAM97_10350 [Acidimicrobiales bacterium]